MARRKFDGTKSWYEWRDEETVARTRLGIAEKGVIDTAKWWADVCSPVPEAWNDDLRAQVQAYKEAKENYDAVYDKYHVEG